MEVRLLGPVELIGDQGGIVAVGGPKERALLGVLASHREQVLSEDSLVEALWGDLPPRTAARTLQSYLSRLRRTLSEASPEAAGAVVSTPGGWQLRLAPDVLDVARVESLAERGRAAAARGDHLGAALAFADALRAWRGRPLEEFADHPWAILEGGRLEELHQAIAEDRAEAELACGRHAELVGDLEALCRAHPLRERPRAQLMVALYRSGRQAEALRVYQDLRKTLGEELGIDPAPALARLEQQILLQDPALEWHRNEPVETSMHVAPARAAEVLEPAVLAENRVVTVLAAQLPGGLLDRADVIAAFRETVASSAGIELRADEDGLTAVFTSAVEAIGCAVAMQKLARRVSRSQEGLDLQVGIGLHTGDSRAANGSDRAGPEVVAALLAGAAGPDQILASQVVTDLVGSRGGYQFTDAEPANPNGSGAMVAAYLVEWAKRSAARLPSLLAGLAEVTFVGRDGEIKTLDRAWRQARDGLRQVTLIAGEPGIGKTTLASRVAATASDQDAAVLFGRCDEESLVAFQPFVEAIGQYVEATSPAELRTLLGGQAGDLALLVPALGRRLPELSSVIGTGAETERYRIFEAVVAFFTALGEQGSFVLVLDDLHWADRPTLGLFQHLIRRSQHVPMLVIGTYRDTDLVRTHPMAETLVDLRRSDLVTRVPLHGLSALDVLSLVTGGHAAQPGDRQLADELWGETEGSPLFLREILRHLEETGAAYRDDAGRWCPRRRIDQLGIPEGVREVIGRRLSRLSDAANIALRTGSVLGRQIRLDVLEVVTDLSTDDLLDAMEEAMSAGVIDEVSGQLGRWGFAHALVRQALYDELSLSRRVRLHQRVGEALETLDPGEGPQLAELAYHFSQAAVSGTSDKAIAYAWQAGEYAVTLAAYEQAARHFAMALEVAEDAGTDIELQADLLMAQGDAEMRTDPRVARASFDRVVKMVGDDPERLARAALGYAGAGVRPMWVEMFVVNERVIGLLERALDALPSGDSELKARLLGSLAQELYFKVGAEDRCDELSSEAVSMARRLDDPATLAHVLSARSLAILSPQRKEELDANGAELLAIGEALEDRQIEANGYRFRLLYCNIDQWAESIEQLERWEALIEQLKDPASRAVDRWIRGFIATLEGRFDEAERLGLEGFQIGQEIHDRNAIGGGASVMSILRLYQGRMAEIVNALVACLEVYPSGTSWAHAVLASSFADLGMREEARAWLDRIDPTDPLSLPRTLMWPFALAHLARAYYRLGDRKGASAVYDRLLPLSDTFGIAGTIGGGCLELPLGLAATTIGRLEDAARHFETAIRLNAEHGWRPPLAEAQMHYARLLIGRGRRAARDRAVELLGSAAAIADELGMALIAKEARDLHSQIAGLSEQPSTTRDRAHARAVTRRDKARAKLTAGGLAAVARWTRKDTDEDLIRRFGSNVAQRTLFAAVAKSFQPGMAFGFTGDIVLELRPPDDEPDPSAADWWTIEVRGRRASARRGRSANPAVVIHVGLADSVRVASGEIHPVRALIENRIEVEGDFMLAARLPDMFGAVEPDEGLARSSAP